MLWKITVQTAVMEHNPALLRQRVWDAETVLVQRWRQLAKNEFFEDRELRKAANVLWEIKCSRLGYPCVTVVGVTAANTQPTDPEVKTNVLCI